MFERRLRMVLYVLGSMLLIIVGRLAQLQIVQAEFYRERADRALRLTPTPVPFVRGSILDRTGEVLIRDEPCWDLAIDYAVIAADVEDDFSAIKRQAKRWRRRGWVPHGSSRVWHRRETGDTRGEPFASPTASRERRVGQAFQPVSRPTRKSVPQAEACGSPAEEEIVQEFRDELVTMWNDIARFMADRRPASVKSPRQRARDIYNHVGRIRRAVAERRGFDAPVAEENDPHAVVLGLDAGEQITARELFKSYPWVHVEPSSVRRFAADATPFAHVLGRMGNVDATHVANDQNADDPFARYRADERLGISGVEFVGEATLRGRRGQVSRDLEGNLVEEGSIEAENGRDVTLTVHADLQRRLYRLLGEVVDDTPESPGGAIIVLDVSSREVLALVSYPSYDPNRFQELYPTLRDDTESLPLRFRAVANRYVPGSTVKPLVCLAGLLNGTITLDSREVCTGYMFDDQPSRWRCWQIHGTTRRMTHGPVDVVDALTGSCNIFMYRLGERLGVDGLCSVFDMVGIGRYSGIGLREEVRGINPTPSWLMTHKNIRTTPGTARLFAIGQGELAMTPVQVANLMAIYANGRYRPVTLVRSDTPMPEWTIPATPEQWAAIRRGIFGVVNNPSGTAYKHARFEHDRWVLCGKSGSATAYPWPTSYRIPYVTQTGVERVTIVNAGARRAAIRRFSAEHPKATFDPLNVEVAARWPRDPPPPGQGYSHAWFGGFLQAIDGTGQPDWSQEPPIAFVVLVEFGGSGGRTSGPLAKAVVRELLNVFGPDLHVGPGSKLAMPVQSVQRGGKLGQGMSYVSRGL